MKDSGRYKIHPSEDYEPDSHNEVLKNRLGIKSKEEMDLIEARALKRTEIELVSFYDQEYIFTAKDICYIHKLWLKEIYPFAGKYRKVNLAKDNFQFASSHLISFLMQQFEKDFLIKYTPCQFVDVDELAYALGVVHVELILIHPFREGNGRTARLLAILMALQAGYPPLNFYEIDQTVNEAGYNEYIRSIHAGLNKNYKPIANVFKKLIESTISF